MFGIKLCGISNDRATVLKASDAISDAGIWNTVVCTSRKTRKSDRDDYRIYVRTRDYSFAKRILKEKTTSENR